MSGSGSESLPSVGGVNFSFQTAMETPDRGMQYYCPILIEDTAGKSEEVVFKAINALKAALREKGLVVLDDVGYGLFGVEALSRTEGRADNAVMLDDIGRGKEIRSKVLAACDVAQKEFGIVIAHADKVIGKLTDKKNDGRY